MAATHLLPLLLLQQVVVVAGRFPLPCKMAALVDPVAAAVHHQCLRSRLGQVDLAQLHKVMQVEMA
jgi:hypothetical protein